MSLLSDVKACLRITSSSHDTEITDLIDACKEDLKLAGILSGKITDTDSNIKRAIITYCKANFGLDNANSVGYTNAYNIMLGKLSVDYHYKYYEVSFIVTEGEDSPVQNAIVYFGNESKYTDLDGVAKFYCRENTNAAYLITYNGSTVEEDYVSITDDTEIEVSL